jgi:hypothetical protein
MAANPAIRFQAPPVSRFAELVTLWVAPVAASVFHFSPGKATSSAAGKPQTNGAILDNVEIA